MSVQVRRRRETAAFLSTFVGAQGELLVDTTNNRVQVHDGTTPGGFPAARLLDLPSSATPLPVGQGGTGATTASGALAALGAIGRTTIADANYTALASDRTIAFTSLTAARVIALPAAGTYPTGTQILVVDESGVCSATNTISLTRAGTDTINGATSAVLALAYGYIALVSNGAGKWTIIDQSTASMAQQAANAVAITGGTINGTPLGATSPSTVAATTLSTTGAASFGGPITYAGAATCYFGLSGTSNGYVALQPVAGSSFAGYSAYYTADGTRHGYLGYAGGSNLVLATENGWGLNVNTVGPVTFSNSVVLSSTLKLASYTVATLPAAGTAGRMVWCSNARMFNGAGVQEAASAGTGGLVTDNGTAWKVAGTNITATA